MVRSGGSGADDGTRSGGGPGGGGVSAVTIASPGTPGPLVADVEPKYASWGQRVVAAILDYAILAGVTWLALGPGFSVPTLTPGWGTVADDARAAGPMVLVPIAALVLLLSLQALTGWTPGRLATGIRPRRTSRPSRRHPAASRASRWPTTPLASSRCSSAPSSTDR